MREIIYEAQDMGMTDPTQYVWLVFYNIYADFPFNMLFEPWDQKGVKEDTTTDVDKTNINLDATLEYNDEPLNSGLSAINSSMHSSQKLLSFPNYSNGDLLMFISCKNIFNATLYALFL